MSADEEQFGAKVRGYLDSGAAELRSGLAYRLQQARGAALARLAEQPRTAEAPGLVTATGGAVGGSGSAGRTTPGRPLYAQVRVWLAAGIIAAALVGYQQWTAWQELQELEDLDAQILTSDLPIDAYLDRGFQHWLTTSKPEE